MPTSDNFEDTIAVVLGGTVTAGTMALIQGCVGMYMKSGVSGDTVAFKITGKLKSAPKKAAETWTPGQLVYWEAGSSSLTATSTSNTFAGIAASAQLSADTAGDVILLGRGA